MPTYEHLQEVGPAVAASGPERPSRSPSYRHAKYAQAPTSTAQSLYAVFQQSVKLYANEPCLGYRPVDPNEGSALPYEWMTYKQVSDKVDAFAASLSKAGLVTGDRVAIFGVNCCEWMIAMQACNRMGYECVPLYDSLGENAIEYIIDHSEAKVVVISTAKLGAFAAALPKITQRLLAVFYWGTDAKALQTSAPALQQKGISMTGFEQALEAGAAEPVQAQPPQRDTICTIMYTSGTTGDPKGVLLSHGNVISCVEGVLAYMKANNLEIDHRDVSLSYLPLAHIFDRTLEETFLSIGARIGYWQGKLPALVDDIGACKPTIFIGVPRVFDKIHNGVLERISGAGCIKKFLFNWGYKAKLGRLREGRPSEHAAPLWDKIVFSKMKARLGGNVRAILSGGAPLAPHVEEFLKVAMCAPVVQGYGLTETCAASFIALPDNPAQAGTVGPPLPVTEFCLESVPEMKYDAHASPAAGELLVRGPNVFQGYYKMQDKTVEVLEKDGWFHTGDVAELQADGSVRIVDRKKNIFKLAQGEYIAVEKLEAEFKKCSVVNQIWVYGNSFESQLVAVVVPKEEPLRQWADDQGLKYSDFAGLCQLPEVRQYVVKKLTEQGKASKLRGFEFVKAVHLDHEEFSVERDTITPTYKLRRPQLKDAYQSELDAMYARLKAAN